MRFRTTLVLNGKTATGIEVPEEIVAALGSGKRPPVRVTIGKHYRSTVAPMGGQFWLPVSAENRTAAGVAAGEEVDVDVELDTEPRTVIPPPDFADTLRRDAAAGSAFAALSYSHQRRHVLAIEDAKTPGRGSGASPRRLRCCATAADGRGSSVLTRRRPPPASARRASVGVGEEHEVDAGIRPRALEQRAAAFDEPRADVDIVDVERQVRDADLATSRRRGARRCG